VCLTSRGEIVTIFNSLKNGPWKNWSGASKGMEGFGVDEICKELKNAGLKISAFVHDDDSCTASIIRKHFGEEIVEYLDPNHKIRNVKKRLFTAKFLELTEDAIERIVHTITNTFFIGKISTIFALIHFHINYIMLQSNIRIQQMLPRVITPFLQKNVQRILLNQKHIRICRIQQFSKKVLDYHTWIKALK